MKLFLGGGEAEHVGSTLVNAGAPFVSVSYVELRKKSKKAISNLLFHYKQHDVTLLLTSGSARIIKENCWYNPNTLEIKEGPEYDTVREQIDASGMDATNFIKNKIREVTEYGEEYLKFGVEHQLSFEYIVEFDVHTVVPPTTVYLWRQEWLRFGVDPIIVHHGPWIQDDFHREAYLESSHEFIGLVQPDVESANLIINSFDGEFKKRGKKFFGIGVSKQKVLQQVPLYAAYSTSWLSGARYKAVFDSVLSGKLKRVIDSNIPERARGTILDGMKNKVEAAGIDFDGFRLLDYGPLNEWNCLKWVELANHLKESSSGAYWVSDEDRHETALAKKEVAPLLVPQVRKPIEEVGKDLRLSLKRQCNSCVYANNGCSVYEKDASCKLDAQYEINNGQDVLQAYGSILSAQVDRVSFALAIEKMTGQVLSADVSEEMERTTRMMKDYRSAEQTLVSETVAHAGAGGVTFIQRMFAQPSTPSGGQNQLARAEKETRRAEIRARLAAPEEDDVDVIDADFE